MATKLLYIEEAADRLGKSVDGLRWMVYSGTAPRSAKIGRRRVWRESDIEDYIEAQFAVTDDGKGVA